MSIWDMHTRYFCTAFTAVSFVNNIRVDFSTLTTMSITPTFFRAPEVCTYMSKIIFTLIVSQAK